MNTPEPQRPDSSAPQPEATFRGIASIERAFLRLTFWQTLLSLAGVFTGAVALYAALNESQAVREQTAASVWPYVQVMISDTDDGEKAHFALSFENVGVGPARMQGLRFTLDGKPLLTWDDITDHLSEAPLQVGVDYGRSHISRRVMAPGETVIAFHTAHRPLVLALQNAVYEGRADLGYCYCSIFDACWLVQAWNDDGAPAPQPIDRCAGYGDGAFRD